MKELNTVGIKQEMREDIKDILDNIEHEYDDDDIVIYDSDVSDFLTEEEDNGLMDSSSDNYIDSSLNEIVFKTEPSESLDSSFKINVNNSVLFSNDKTEEYTETGYFSTVRSELMQEIKTEENTPVYSSYHSSISTQHSNYNLQSSHGYQETVPAQVNNEDNQYRQPEEYQQHCYDAADTSNYSNDAGNYSVDAGNYSDDAGNNSVEVVEDDWKKEIKTENLYSIDKMGNSNYVQGSLQAPNQNQSKPDEDGWIVDNTVPLGWKHKTSSGNNKTFVWSPNGQKFDSRKNALKFMKTNNYPFEEIAVMDDCLKYEGWKVDEYLPEGWKYRPGKSIGIEYMTSEEKIINSTSGASKEIGAFYPPETWNRFKFFSQKLKKDRHPVLNRASSYLPQTAAFHGRVPVPKQARPFPPQRRAQPPMPAEWTVDHTIPSAWRMSNSSGKFILLSPNGIQFDSRRAAFQEMVTKNYPDQMKADMFDKLAFEGFQANELLPFGWIYQKTENELNFLNREGRLLSSFRQAFEFVRSNRGFSSEEVQRFETFHKLIAASAPKTVVVWNENDQTVPIGWKTKPAGNGNQKQKVFLSPNGYELKSRRLSLKHMIEFGYSQEAVEEMRTFLYYEGWMDDQTLPYLWKMKKNGSNLMFVSIEGDLLDSSKVAIDYIQKNLYTYSQEDVQRIEYVSSMVQNTVHQNKGRVKNQIQSNDGSRSMNKLPSQISVRKVDTSYVEDGSVPKGWKAKTDGQRASYMAPNGTTYKSRRTAYQSMIQERYPNEEIEAMRKTLKHDGWLDNSELPDGWKMKQMTNNIYLMDRGGELFKSYLEAAKFIEAYVQYFTEEDVEKINRLARVNQPHKARSSSSLSQWTENDTTVPRGWKSKGRAGKGKILMSPDGVIFNSRKSALEIMVKSHASEELLEEIRTSLAHEGWTKMDIPQCWMYKPLSAYGYHFLSNEGILLESKSRALEHLMKGGQLTEGNKRSIDMLKQVNKVIARRNVNVKCQQRAPQQITPDATWTLGDVTVPEGWRVKEFEHHGKSVKMILSPTGLSFRNRRSALSYMIKNNFPPEEIDEIRQGLAHDGWKEDEKLPTNWRFKPKRPFLYCNEEGEILISHINAIRKVQSSDKYTLEQIESLKRFIDGHGGTRKEYERGGRGNISSGHLSLTKIFENAVSKGELMKTLDGLGWMQNQYLPTDWRFKNRSEGNMHIDVLSAEGKRYNSYKQAIVFMRSSEKYSEKDIEDFSLFPDGKTKINRMTETRIQGGNQTASNEWVENDETVPVGWKSKLWLGSATKKCLLSPEGQVFNTRIGAFKYLLKYGTPEQVGEMRNLLSCDGWQEYALLPEGWLYRKKEYNNLYLTHLGEKLSGNTVALKYIQENKMFLDKLDDLKTFFAETKSDKFNASQDKTYQKSSSIGNLRWLVESGADEEHINKARMELMEVGWKGNQYLPENWLHKEKGKNHILSLLSAEGMKYPSYKAAIQFMRNNYKYTESDIQKLKLFPDGKTSSKFESTRYNDNRLKVTLDDPNWKEGDVTVPKGWKSKKIEGRDVTMLQSPNGLVYWSRRAALKSLLKNGASSEEIDEVKNSLVNDGWKTFDNLPTGWMYKRKQTRSLYLTETGDLVDGHTKAQKLVAEQEKFSIDDQTNIRNFVLQIFQTEKSCVEKSPKLRKQRSSLFESLQQKLRTGSNEERGSAQEELEAKGWKENTYLPDGWMSKEYKSTQQINVVSAEGEVFHSYKSVLQKLSSDEKYTLEDSERFKRFPNGKLHKVEINKPTIDKVKGKFFNLKQYQEALKKENNAEEIQEIQAYYIQKGWIEDDTLLPAMWMFRQKSGMTSLSFLTSSGEMLLSTKEANKYLESHGVKQVIDAYKCKARCGTNYELELKRIEKKVKLEPNVKIPSGIKIKKAFKHTKEETKPIVENTAKTGKVAADASRFKFYSLEEFDSKNNVGLQEFKGVFEKLESFKKTIKQEVKTEMFDDLDLL